MLKSRLLELKEIIDSFKIKEIKEIDDNSCFINSKVYEVVLASGEKFKREKLIKAGNSGDAVIIISRDSDNNFTLVVEPRVFTKEGFGMGFPAGYVEENETYIDAAKRELYEETGMVSEELIDLGGHYQDVGISEAYNHIVLANNCKKVSDLHLDKDEYIKNFKCNYDELLELYQLGYIKDANSEIGVLKLEKYLEGSDSKCLMKKKKQIKL